ncbi:MAG: acetyl-CoA carboxylase biotin carboxyl carrier protein subunit [Melioribacteraceae bacterium]
MNEFIVTINQRKYSVKVSDDGEVSIGEKSFKADLSSIADNAYVIRINDRVFEITSNKLEKERFGIIIDACYFDTSVRTLLQEQANELQKNKSKLNHHSDVKAPMPGLLLKLKVKIGDEIKLGDSILILEAMKMENELRSPASGIVKNIFFQEGQSVEKDSIILTIE